MGAKQPSSPLETAFGPLENRVLEALWARDTAACVRDLQPQFPQVAYTTLMTTLDRLYRKGALTRHKDGRAFYYRPTATRPELVSQIARPIISMFVENIGQRDRALLDELEALVREQRARLEEGDR
ncbi:MAG TPA: BlaI/MecI/CopY family transcriptional regulator [Vicinamibacterales bacterium]|nr:BlaI/MecI/CopY family transcriptional regulator [Vicinamibacterales bacterium]